MEQESLSSLFKLHAGNSRAEQLMTAIAKMIELDIFDMISSGSHGEGAAMMNLYLRETPLQPTQLKEMLKVSGSRITAVLLSLEKKGYIERADDPLDRRRSFVSLTEAGKAAAAHQYSLTVRLVENQLDMLGEEDTEALLRILQKLQADPPASAPSEFLHDIGGQT